MRYIQRGHEADGHLRAARTTAQLKYDAHEARAPWAPTGKHDVDESERAEATPGALEVKAQTAGWKATNE